MNTKLKTHGNLTILFQFTAVSRGVFFWHRLFSADCLLFVVGFKILFFWYCLPRTVGLEGLLDPLLRELEDFADFARILVLMC